MLIESWLLMEQTTHRTDQAQLTAPTAARHHMSQQGPHLLVPRNNNRVARLATTNSATANKANSHDHALMALMRARAKPSHHFARTISTSGTVFQAPSGSL